MVFLYVPIQSVRAADHHKRDQKVLEIKYYVRYPLHSVEHYRAYDLWDAILEFGAQNSTDHHLEARSLPLVEGDGRDLLLSCAHSWVFCRWFNFDTY
jgi:hypothetical protein